MATPITTWERLEAKLSRELGEQVLSLLADSRTEDIVRNPDGSLWWKALDQDFVRVGEVSDVTAQSAIGTVAAMRDAVVHHESPILETELPLDGSRFTGLLPPIVRRPVFAIRTRPRRLLRLVHYEQAGMLARQAQAKHTQARSFFDLLRCSQWEDYAGILRLALGWRKNTLICGGTGSGKTTLLNALLAELAELYPGERLVLIEDTLELSSEAPNTVDLRAIGRVTMLDCLRVSLRLRPTRIIVGEVRGGEAHALLKSWNTGHPGGLATIHANDVAGALARLEDLVGEATTAPRQQLIAEAIDLVVYLAAGSNGRRVEEVGVVTGYANGRYQWEAI